MDTVERRCDAWNKGKLLGQKPPMKPREIWAIRIRLQLAHRLRDLALISKISDFRISHRVCARAAPPPSPSIAGCWAQTERR